ncbi:MAG: hypothetical protein HY231_21025 [Acidobacteria bacterium]|nr:hypothetical protein [Acidobacteriota bacterium]
MTEAKESGGNQAAQIPLESLVWAMVAVLAIGLGCTIGLMAVMKDVVHFNEGVIIVFTLLSLLLTLVIEGVFVSLLLRRYQSFNKTSDTAPLKEYAPQEVGAATARSLPEVSPSVTEHTTRNFEPSYREAKTESSKPAT